MTMSSIIRNEVGFNSITNTKITRNVGSPNILDHLPFSPRRVNMYGPRLELTLAEMPHTQDHYPIFHLPPDTSFLCELQPVEGYYADPEADCQLYHVCSDGGDGIYTKFDFLCPNGTLFNQAN